MVKVDSDVIITTKYLNVVTRVEYGGTKEMLVDRLGECPLIGSDGNSWVAFA
jgi:hypothetical protein